MKRKLALIAVTAILSIQPAHAKDACRTVLCMAGMVQGAGVVSGCSGAVSDYFSIIKFKHGKFSASRTASARGSFLNNGRMRSFGF